MKLKPGQQLVSMAVLNHQLAAAVAEGGEDGKDKQEDAAEGGDDDAVADTKGPWLLFITTNGKGKGQDLTLSGLGLCIACLCRITLFFSLITRIRSKAGGVRRRR